MARTRSQEWFRYNTMGTADFAAAIGMSEGYVYELVDARWFGWVDRTHAVPECMNVAKDPAHRTEYRFHPSAAERWRKERAVLPDAKAAA